MIETQNAFLTEVLQSCKVVVFSVISITTLVHGPTGAAALCILIETEVCSVVYTKQ